MGLGARPKMEQPSVIAINNDYGRWEELYYASLLELDPDTVEDCNGAAEVAIRSRFFELSTAPGHEAEREAMCEALQSLMELRALDFSRKSTSFLSEHASPWSVPPRWVA
jgi:hypothetical protein